MLKKSVVTFHPCNDPENPDLADLRRFQPIWKISVKMGIFPKWGKNKKYLKPPPSDLWRTFLHIPMFWTIFVWVFSLNHPSTMTRGKMIQENGHPTTVIHMSPQPYTRLGFEYSVGSNLLKTAQVHSVFGKNNSYVETTVTHRKFNIAPENGWLEDYSPFGRVTFQGLC